MTVLRRLRKALISGGEWSNDMKNLNSTVQYGPPPPGAGSLQVEIKSRAGCRGAGLYSLFSAPLSRRL
jgi:hypothetical protein